MYTKNWNELCGIVRNSKYGFIYSSPEDVITKCYEIGEKYEGELGSSGEPQTDVKTKHLQFSIFDEMITDVFQVGKVIVKQVGESREKSKYYMFRVEGVDAIDVFRIDADGTQHPIEEYIFCTRDEIIDRAQQYTEVMTKRSEDVVVNFPTGMIEVSNYFCEDDQGFDDLPKDIQYKREYSICNELGRQNTAQWLADNRNMAYGQLGNTYCTVWKVSDTKLVVTQSDPCYDYEEADDEDYGDGDPYYGDEEIPTPEGWEKVSDVCCDVWRIELVDHQGFADYGFDLESYKKEKTHKEFGSVQVKSGKWLMKTYYNQRSNKELIEEFGYPIWAELNLIEEV